MPTDTTPTSRSARSALLLALVLVVAAVAPVATAGAVVNGGAPGPAQANNSTTTTTQPTTTTAAPTPASNGTPTMADRVRITPFKYDESFLSIQTAERDAVFNTSGPFAQFELSEPVDAARISQPKAKATVLEGGQQVRVSYADSAAGRNRQTLYTLELFFADGSSKQVRLYATKTGVSVAAAQFTGYRDFLDDMCDDAEEHGYECSPSGVADYHQWEKERADLVDHWLSKRVMAAIAILMSAATNWVIWVLVLGTLALLGYWLADKYGHVLDLVANDPGEAARKVDQLEAQKLRQRQNANEEPLEAVDAVGSDAVYWRDGFGTKSPAQLANLAARGMIKRTQDGETEVVHRGVEDLDAETIRDSWLTRVVSPNRIATHQQAVAQLKAACEFMESQYGQGHLYRETADEAARLLDELNERHGLDTPRASRRHRGSSGFGHGRPTDD